MEKRIIFRLPDSMFNEAEKLVHDGKFKNKSAVIREALKQLLDGSSQ